MTIKEFSNNFDTLLNSYAIAEPLGLELPISTIALDEYEKSVLLTLAQEEVLYQIYKGYTPKREGFDETEDYKRYLSPLIEETSITPKKQEGIKYNAELPEDLWFITYEEALFNEEVGCYSKLLPAKVEPIQQDKLHRILANPFKGPNKKRVLRIDSKDNMVELVSLHTIDKYNIKYLKKPTPIILINLPEELSINGETKETESIVHPMLHNLILKTAVQQAYIVKRNNFIQEKEQDDNKK